MRLYPNKVLFLLFRLSPKGYGVYLTVPSGHHLRRREQKQTSLYLNEQWLEIVAIWLDDDHTRLGSEATLSRYVGGIRRHSRGVRSEEPPP